jgi:DNA-binding MarR family transcriptional regulator
MKLWVYRMPKKTARAVEIVSHKQEWTFLSNHAHVLICLYRDPSVRLRDLSFNVGITERAVIRIIQDLEKAGAIERIKDGRRNKYKIHDSISLRHKLESHKTIGDLLKLLK